MQMKAEGDRGLAVRRVIKYLLEGLAVALVALSWLPARDALVLAAAAAAAFAILDVLLPSVCIQRENQARLG